MAANQKSNLWKTIFPILSSTLFGGVVGVIVDFFTHQAILFTAIFGAVGLLIGIVRYFVQKKKA